MTATLSQRVGVDPVRLHANERCEPVSAAIREAITAATDDLHRYPGAATLLADELAAWHGVPGDRVLVGAGSAELISLMWRVRTGPDRPAAFAAPAFELYPIASTWTGAPAVTWPALDPPDLAELAGRTRPGLLAVSNPHNPTGRHVPRRSIAELAAAVPGGGVVLNDEAYAEYATWEPDDVTIADLAEVPNVVTTRTFSKIYGLAALRVGYAIAPAALLAELRSVQPPFSVGRLGIVAASQALADPTTVAAVATRTARDRGVLCRELAARGFVVEPSAANFVFARPVTGPDWPAALLRHGVLVKASGDGLRITVGSAPEIAALLSAIDAVLA